MMNKPFPILRRCLAAATTHLFVLFVGAAALLWSGQAGAGTVRHFLWDSGQRPLYQQCADDFEASHPGIKIRIRQLGWDDYWTSLATGFVSGTAPDVFTNHLSKYSEFVLNGVMVDLAPHIRRDNYTTDDYEPGLLSMWHHQGRQYALPTDWDTVALLVNLDHLKAAGLTLDDLQNLTWNPKDGGSMGRVIERLSVDERGRRGNEPGFDPRHVKVYGYQGHGPGGMTGQTEWSHFAYSAGWRYQAAPWDGALRYDDPLFMDTLQWLATLPERGLSGTRANTGRIGGVAMFLSGRAAMIHDGSWMVNHFIRHSSVPYAWVPQPIGPAGYRASMLNSLGLSIWSGSRNTQEAWQWVSYVGSRACQARLAQSGIVYPAVRGLGEVSAKVQQRHGANTQVFLDAARGQTFQPPIVPHAAEVNDLVNTTLERILSGSARARDVLPEMTRRVRDLTRQP